MAAELDWNGIYRQCAPALRRFIRTRVPEALVDDTLQDTFVRAYRSRARFDAARPPLPWLLAIARRASVETLRAAPRETPEPIVEHASTVARDDVFQHFESRLRRESMIRALSGMSPRHRRLLIAWDVERDDTYPALAAREGVSPKALKSALCRARTAFRERYVALADQAGVAAVVPIWLVRLRTRLQRAWAWVTTGSSLAEAAVGGIAAVLVSAAVVLAPTWGRPDAGREVAVATAVAAIAGEPLSGWVVAPRSTRAMADRESTVDSSRGSDGWPVPRSPVEAGVGRDGIEARGSGGVAIGPDVFRRSVTVDVQYDGEGFRYSDSHEIHCNTAVRQMICDTARRVPLPSEPEE